MCIGKKNVETEKRARLKLTIRGHRAKLSVLLPIGRREIHNTFFIDVGELGRCSGRRALSEAEVGSKVESMPSQDESRESSRVRSSLERFTGRLRAFDPKCTVGAREVEEAEKSRRTQREREKSLSCAAPLIGYVRCTRIVVRGSLSGRKPNIAAVYEKGMHATR